MFAVTVVPLKEVKSIVKSMKKRKLRFSWLNRHKKKDNRMSISKPVLLSFSGISLPFYLSVYLSFLFQTAFGNAPSSLLQDSVLRFPNRICRYDQVDADATSTKRSVSDISTTAPMDSSTPASIIGTELTMQRTIPVTILLR